jgi:hypothetical protein
MKAACQVAAGAAPSYSVRQRSVIDLPLLLVQSHGGAGLPAEEPELGKRVCGCPVLAGRSSPQRPDTPDRRPICPLRAGS